MKTFGKGVGLFAVAAVILSTVFVSLSVSQPVQAATSANVVIIGGATLSADGSSLYGANVMGCTYGGFLPVTGAAGELGDFTFTPMMPANVNAATLAPFDTAVLNVASLAMYCNTNMLNALQKSALLAFVASGKKLIIYDSECATAVNYSWMPYPFVTSNPSATSASGILTILEDSTLASYNPASPYYIDYVHVGANTNAVGNANVMTTFDRHWCVNMSGTNSSRVAGPVHCYAKYPESTDMGLIIYNGLGQDAQWSADPWLRKMWLLELRQSFNPSLLPCGSVLPPPVGISLDPETATNPVGTTHTVVATLKDILGNVHPDVQVTFTIESGPNAGACGTCVPADCMTDANGQVSFTYTSNGQGGTDLIKACFLDQQEQLRCDEAQKEWVAPPANRDEFGYWVFHRGMLKPFVDCVPQSFCIDVALTELTNASGDPIVDPVTGCQKMEYDWTNSSFMWRKTNAYFVQSVTLEKIHGMRKGACNLIWANDYIRQQGKNLETSQVNLCWPLLYETEGTQWVLSIVYQTNPAKPDPSGRSVRVHRERYVWTVDWKARDFSEFRARLNCFARNPAGTCELSAVPPAEVEKILGLLDGRGCEEFGTWDPGITRLMNSADPMDLQKAADKAAQLEALIDTDSCINPCLAFGLPIPGATGILNINQAPVGSVLLTDFYYAANSAGLLRD